MGIQDFYQLPLYREYKNLHEDYNLLLKQRQAQKNKVTCHDIYSMLEDILNLLYSICPSIDQVQEQPQEYTSYTQKSILYAEFLHDLQQLGLWLTHCTSQNSHELEQELKEFCDKLLTLYGQAVIALEKLLSRAHYFCKRAPLAYNLYSNSIWEEHFKSCIYTVTTHDKLSVYYVDVACLFDQLRRTLSYYTKTNNYQ